MMNDNLMVDVVGGAAISGSVLNSISRLISTVLEIGRTVGSSIRMLVTKKRC